MKKLLSLLLAISFVTATAAITQEEDCRGFIDTKCCCTKSCCFQIRSTDILPQPNDHYLILATGQLIKRTGWSPDGTIMRCACKYVDGQWVQDVKENTLCLYVPQPNS
jgi:hypothetical protein